MMELWVERGLRMQDPHIKYEICCAAAKMSMCLGKTSVFSRCIGMVIKDNGEIC